MKLTINLLMLFIIILIYSNNEKIEYINHKYNYNITPIDPNVPKRKIYVKYMDFWPAFKIEEFVRYSRYIKRKIRGNSFRKSRLCFFRKFREK